MSSTALQLLGVIFLTVGLFLSTHAAPLTTYGRCDFPSVPVAIPNGLAGSDLVRTVDFLDQGPQCLCLPGPDNKNCSAGFSACDVPVSTSHIVDVRVSLLVDHDWTGELRGSLLNETSGTSVTLFDLPGPSRFGCSNDNIDIVLDDASFMAAENTCNSSSPALRGQLAPDERMVPFRNQLPRNSSWSLVLEDSFADNIFTGDNSGSLVGWCVEIDVDNSGDLIWPLYNTPLGAVDGGFGCGAPTQYLINSSRDVDWIRYSANAGLGVTWGTHAAELSLPAGSGVDPLLALYDERILTDPRTLPLAITGSCVDGATPPLRVEPSLNQKYFYVRAQNCPGGSPGSYTLDPEPVAVAMLFPGICLAATEGPLPAAHISGSVVEQGSGQILPGAVVVSNQNDLVFVDFFGAYEIEITAGDMTVTAFTEQHQAKVIDLGFVSGDSAVTANFSLTPASFDAVGPDNQLIFTSGFEG